MVSAQEAQAQAILPQARVSLPQGPLQPGPHRSVIMGGGEGWMVGRREGIGGEEGWRGGGEMKG